MAYANDRGQRERESILDLIERRRETIENSQYFQGQPAQTAPIITDTFTELVQPETEEPKPEEQNVPTVEEQKKEETPTVEPITEPVETVQEQEPVVQPVVAPKTNTQEETKQPEVVQANDTETLYNDWESYLAEQDRANAVIDTGTTTQPVDETPLVTPVTNNSALENALNYMQTDLGIPIYGEPTADDIAYAQQLINDGVIPLPTNTPTEQPQQITPLEQAIENVNNGNYRMMDNPANSYSLGSRYSQLMENSENLAGRVPYAERAESAMERAKADVPPSTIGVVNPKPTPQIVPSADYNPYAYASTYDEFGDVPHPALVPAQTNSQQPDVFTPPNVPPEIAELMKDAPTLMDTLAQSVAEYQDLANALYDPTTEGDPLRKEIDRLNSGDLRATDVTHGRPVSTGQGQPVTQADVNPTLRFAESDNPSKPYTPQGRLDFTPPNVPDEIAALMKDAPTLMDTLAQSVSDTMQPDYEPEVIPFPTPPDWRNNFELNEPILSQEPEYGTPRTSGYERAEENSPTGTYQPRTPYFNNEQYLIDQALGLVDDSFTPEELAKLYGETVDSTTWDGTTGTPRTSGYERAERDFIEKPNTVYDAIADVATKLKYDFDPERMAENDREDLIYETIRDNNLDNTPEVRDRIGALLDQIAADDDVTPREIIPVKGEEVKQGLSTAVDTVFDIANALNPATVAVPIISDVLSDTVVPAADNWNEASQAAEKAGFELGTPEADEFIRDYIQDKKQAEQEAEQNREDYISTLMARSEALDERNRVDNLPWWSSEKRAGRREELRERIDKAYEEAYKERNDYARFLESRGYTHDEAVRIAKEAYPNTPADYSSVIGATGYDNTGALNDAWNTLLSGNELAGTEVPGYNADGTPNATLQAILDGNFATNFFNAEDLESLKKSNPEYYEIIKAQNAESALAPYNTTDGKFQGLDIPPEIAKYLATSVGTAAGMELSFYVEGDGTIRATTNGKVEYINAKQEDVDAALDKLIAANKPLKDMLDAGVISRMDIYNHFFKAIGTGAKPKGSGSGSGYGYGRYGGGGGGGSYGGGGGGYSRGSSGSAPSAKSQTEQRINNIMKNWTF